MLARSFLVLAGLGLCLCLSAPATTYACCMVPATYKGTISQSAQEALIFHHKGREELILRINYKIAGKGMPDRFAWIITVPAEPDAYHLVAPNFFPKVFAWANPYVKIPTQSRGSSLGKPKAVTNGVELGRRAVVGPYDIQPVRALGVQALGGLNRWLKRNGFPTEDREHMKYFVEKGFTFLCVKVTPPGKRSTVLPRGELPPIQLSFASERPYYPLKFSSRQGVFDLNLYVLTQRPFDFDASKESLANVNWLEGAYNTNVLVKSSSFPKVLRDVYRRGKVTKAKSWHLNVIRTRRVNRNNAIASWKQDIFFDTKPRVAIGPEASPGVGR